MKTALLTGANSGIGYELLKLLLQNEYEVIALLRTEIQQHDPVIQMAIEKRQLRIYRADLGNFSELKSAIEKIKANESRIDVLFNNAAVGIGELKYSLQGRELHFEINTVVPYIIMMEMKELLHKGELKMIINVSSNALLTVKQYNPFTLEKPTSFKKLFGPYATSKLSLSLWTMGLADRLRKEGLEIKSVCPGPNKTRMTGSDGMPWVLKMVAKVLFPAPTSGARQIYEALINHIGETGVFINKGKVTPIKWQDKATDILYIVDAAYMTYLRV